ncbi:hypothetical protein SLS62_000713 [Diatrype stigma]|uniref:DUF7924 domain-containing protein n=1 Tax=Diatrype stigma TaxID=117547 RepID=A0AAN9UX31_9PEZI
MTEELTTLPAPDSWDGVESKTVDVAVRKALAKFILPTKDSNDRRPIVPNFFLEIKSPGGDAVVAGRQVLNNGAYGARAIHYLQQYGSREPVYDNKAHVFSATYQNGLLSLFAHHVTPPCRYSPNGHPEIWMTEIDTYALRAHKTGFANGVAAFRNLRDKALQERIEIVQGANARHLELDAAWKEFLLRFTRDLSDDEDMEDSDDSALEDDSDEGYNDD